MYCDVCGSKQRADANYCRSCGAYLHSATSGLHQAGPQENARPPNSDPAAVQSRFSDGLHPWRRFFARSCDLIVFATTWSILLWLVIAMVSPESADGVFAIENPVLGPALVYGAWLPLETLLISLTGATPSKWIFGISVADRSTQAKLSISRSGKRAAGAFLAGDGAGISILTLVCRVLAYRRLRASGSTLWDDFAGSTVRHRRWGVPRTIAATGLVAVAFLLVGSLLL